MSCIQICVPKKKKKKRKYFQYFTVIHAAMNIRKMTLCNCVSIFLGYIIRNGPSVSLTMHFWF